MSALNRTLALSSGLPELRAGVREPLRRLTASAAAAESAAAEAEPAKKPRYKRKNLAEVAAYLPENGLGGKFTRLLWIRNGYEQSHWTITRIKLNPRGEPRFYGRLTWKGVDATYNRRVNSQCNRGWRFIRDLTSTTTTTTTTSPSLSNALS